MNDTGESIDWRKLREFADVDLERSYVLSCKIESGTFLIDVDLHLQSGHAFYEKPRPAQKVCIRPAVIEFRYCESVTPDAGDIGHGAITGLRRLADGRYELGGDFGVVLIDAERPILRLKEP